MKAGDLVCYNCAGMRKHTMGYVISEFETRERYFFQIRWIKKGKFMPTFSYDYYTFRGLPTPWAEKYTTGSSSYHWYENTDLFEVIQ